MTTIKRNVLQPNYLRHFSCIGGECEDNCCTSNWDVAIDRATYESYQQLPDGERKETILGSMEMNASDPRESHYATIALTDHKKGCPLLTDEGLCSIHLELGENMLSETCHSYPRLVLAVEETIERTAVISCPEIARLALLNPDGIEFDQIEYEFPKAPQVSAVVKGKPYFWDLRIFTIGLLQNRAFSLSDRLIMLGSFYQKVDTFVSQGTEAMIPAFIKNFQQMLEGTHVQETLKQMEGLLPLQFELAKRMVEMRMKMGVRSTRYQECLTEMLAGLGYSDQSSINELTTTYQDIYENDYLPFAEKHAYILENYLVHQVFSHLFPYSRPSISESFQLLVLQYALLRLHWVGLAGYHKEALSVDHIVKLCQSFDKAMGHHPLVFSTLLKWLDKNGYNTIGHMAVLIKD